MIAADTGIPEKDVVFILKQRNVLLSKRDYTGTIWGLSYVPEWVISVNATERDEFIKRDLEWQLKLPL